MDKGQNAIGTYNGQRIHVRWGTSNLGPEWEITHGDLFGHIPADQLTDVVLGANEFAHTEPHCRLCAAQMVIEEGLDGLNGLG